MGQICSICGFKEKPQQQATANVETSLRGVQASHQSQRPHSSSPLVNMFINLSSSANVIFFLYTEGATVPWHVTHLRFGPSVAALPYRAFMGRRRLKEVILPEGLTVIGSGAFEGCNSLERINFPSTLTDIGPYAFYNCTSLREVDLSNVITIGEYAFMNCTSLGHIFFQTLINLPSTVTAIGPYAFYKCTSLSFVKLFGGIMDIGARAFQGCSSLIGRSLIQFQIPYKAITPTSDVQVVIASNCLKYMSVTGLAEVENRINAITSNREQTRDVIVEQIRALFAYYELVEATTILELVLWKAKVDEGDDLNTREECHFTCGAGIIIPIVLPFL